ncbi:MAG: alpha/beta-hydrolase family protein, partial [Actinomycetia bacterium]|nr:alpha/beta-hydrolase family protein [Actinomycetes bacterium]
MRIIGPSLMEWPSRVRTLFPVALTGVGATTVVGPPLVAWSVLRLARSVSAADSDRARASGMGVGVGVASVAVVSLVAGTVVARRRFVTNTANAARDLDPGFREPPVSPLVSTGPGSLVDPRGVGREGARYVGTATTGDDVRFVTGAEPIADPIRVFVGLDAGASVQQRVDLAMAELRRTGAFDRSHLVIQAPAGSGYANATPVDVVELLSRGDCASVAVGYGLLPSFLSLNRVDLARRTQQALLEAITAECDERSARSARPRLLLFGESLGAKVQQAAFAAGVADLDRFGIDAALWVGTPGGVDYDDVHRAFDHVAVTLDRPAQI